MASQMNLSIRLKLLLLLLLGAASCATGLPLGGEEEESPPVRRARELDPGTADLEAVLRLVRGLLDVATGSAVGSATSLSEVKLLPDAAALKKLLQQSPPRDPGLLGDDGAAERLGRDVLQDLLPEMLERSEQSLDHLLQVFRDTVLVPLGSALEFKTLPQGSAFGGMAVAPQPNLYGLNGNPNDLLGNLMGGLKLLSSLNQIFEKLRLFV
ncbi:uncharacterized protein LOC134533151 [Bacillus rossius redtenbacheri]|uniref:uncharacterized protein LOC134533151 n=1 Tax=Bacillus rossius redtenbacheri TaxID=93214 RepID=UPI002FDD2B04